MKHWWNVSGTSPSGLKHNYVWHLRQMLCALIPPTVALLTLEACSRWQKNRSAAAFLKVKPGEDQENKGDSSNIAHRHQKATSKQQQSSPEVVISPDQQPTNRWTTTLSWWYDQVTKLQDTLIRGGIPSTSPGPPPSTAVTTKQLDVDKGLQQQQKEKDSEAMDVAVLARLNAMESELSLLRQQLTTTKSPPPPPPPPPPLLIMKAGDPTDTTPPTTGLHHNTTGPLMWTSLSFLLILSRLWTSQAKFDPYMDNGGTVVGITGRNYAIIASDTRLSESYVIRSRNISKIFEVANGVYLAASGCLSDTIALSKVMQSEMKLYEWQNERKPTVSVLAHCLANVLYSRRHFPYYSVCAVAGLDAKGSGALYRYDAVGSFERVRAVCAGKGEQLIQPILDEITDMEEDETLFLFPAQLSSDLTTTTSTTSLGTGGRRTTGHKELDVEEACEVIVRAFKAAAEREISIGDGIDLVIVRGDESDMAAGQPLGQDRESMSIVAGDTMVPATSDPDEQPMTEKSVARTIDERLRGTKTQRVSIERRSFSLPRH